MAEESWVLIGLSESDGGGRGNDFWNLTYEVPERYSNNGMYCVSIPKILIENYAIEFGYDIENPDEVDALFKHISYLGPMIEKDKENGVDPSTRIPRLLGAKNARASVHEQIAEIEQNMPVIQRNLTRIKMGVKAYGAETPEINTEIDLFEVMKADTNLHETIPELKRKIYDRNTGMRTIERQPNGK